LRGSSALASVDAKLEAARVAQATAEQEQAAMESAYHQHRSIPAKVEQLTGRVANLESERNRLTNTDFDAKIRQILEANYNPKPGMVIHESVGNLLMQRDTLKLRREVIADLLQQCATALAKLSEDNTKLADQLGIRPHKL
jgi:hypothetical protein